MALVVRDVTVRFGGHIALDGVNLMAEAGRITGLIGPNGAGKTTLFNVITGVQAPRSGRVELDGRDLTGAAPFQRARLGLGRTFQRLELFGSLTVRENIRVAAGLAHRRGARHPDSITEDLLIRLELSDIAGTRADAMSTGQGRVVELARALAAAPSVLLLDEPASGQDDAETARFAGILRNLSSEGLTIVLVEHDIELVMGLCDELHVLDFGKVIASGPPAHVRDDVSVRAAYLGEEASA